MASQNHRLAELQARLAALQARMSDIDAQLAAPLSHDSEDQATEREDDEVLQGVGLAARQEALLIHSAIERIGSGDYGTCAQCGGEIGAARLDVLPFTPLCRDCAAVAEDQAHG